MFVFTIVGQALILLPAHGLHQYVCPVACQVNRYPHVNLLSGGDILR